MVAYGLPLGGRREIIADRREAITGREIVIPGLRNHPDQPPRTASPWDIEFWRGQMRQGYTEVNSPSWNYNSTVKGHLVWTMAANQSRRMLVWPSPPAPFTVTAKIASMAVYPSTTNNSQQFGICISDSSPDTTNVAYMQWTTNGDGTSNCSMQGVVGGTTTMTGTPGYGIARPVYLKIVVASATSVTMSFSFDGLLYTTVRSNQNPGWTPATFGFVGFTGTTLSNNVSFAVPWIRVTVP